MTHQPTHVLRRVASGHLEFDLYHGLVSQSLAPSPSLLRVVFSEGLRPAALQDVVGARHSPLPEFTRGTLSYDAAQRRFDLHANGQVRI
jgi:hypothetical protein